MVFSLKSTTTQLVECFLDWCTAIGSGHPDDVIYLDYATPFDFVVHLILFGQIVTLWCSSGYLSMDHRLSQRQSPVR